METCESTEVTAPKPKRVLPPRKKSPPVRKKKRNGRGRTWSPEQRAAQSEMMRRTRAEKKWSSRFGIPDGKRKKAAKRMWGRSRTKARKTMAELEKAGVLDGMDDYAKEALQTGLEVMRAKVNQTVRLQAARLVLDFTKAKPASKAEITVNKAEEWLAAIAASEDDGDKQGEAPTDA
jgi:hypothetical protein